ncbi:MAG: hypothetical protein EP344_09770 [Bacteroidetes bacterium]|nr:MAG: hypothetical protein EP344_09770 [Bacteroidota bacterium]
MMTNRRDSLNFQKKLTLRRIWNLFIVLLSYLTDGYWTPKISLYNHCWKLWHSGVVTWDDQVVPCRFDKDARHRLGNLKTAGFRDIWRGAAYQAFRQQILNGRDQIEICTNCSEGCRV